MLLSEKNDVTSKDVFDQFIKVFKVFGLMPYNTKRSTHPDEKNRRYFVRCRISIITIVIFLILYYVGVIAAFNQFKINTDLISRVINSLQMIMTVIAMTTALVTKIHHIKIFNLIIAKFDAIDKQLNNLGAISKDMHKNEFQKFFVGFLTSFAYMTFYQVCSYIMYINRPVQQLWYHIVANIPIVFYSFALFEAFSMIKFLNKRYLVLNDVVIKFNCYERKSDGSDKSETLQNIFNTINDMIALNKYIGEYYGAILLTTFATVFTIATVQSYFVYLIIANFGQYKGLDTHSLVHALLMDVTCFILLISITSMCQKLLDSSKIIINNLSKNIKKTEVSFDKTLSGRICYDSKNILIIRDD